MNWYKISQQEGPLKILREKLKAEYPGLDLDVWESSNDYIELAMIRLPKEMQSQGIGTKVIREIQDYANQVGKPIVISPQPGRGKKKSLESFYRNLGFVRNRGRNMDYQLSSFFGPTSYWRPEPRQDDTIN